MKYIELTNYDNDTKMCINTKYIILFCPSALYDGATAVVMRENNIFVKETYDQILALLSN